MRLADRSRRHLAILTALALTIGSALAVGGFAVTSAGAAATATSLCPDANVAAFGPNVCVFNDTMTQAAIQADLDAIATQQVPVASQFDSNRYAIFFQPGSYGSKVNPLVFQVGYYTEVAGLGYMPQDTVINDAIDVFNNLCTPHTTNCNSDDNFLRSLSNLTLNVDLPSSPPAYAPPALDAFGAGCANSAEMWSVSQAAPIRRAIINGSVVFQDYCSNNNFTSGGFIADSQVSGNLDFYGNQQYMVRNSDIGGANGCPNRLWNMVYSGVQGAPSAVFTGSCQQNTVLPASPITAEEPFLYTNSDGNYNVFVPAVQRNSSGPSWAGGSEAWPVHPAVEVLHREPGHAGLGNSPVLPSVGHPGPSSAADPDTIQDVFFRIGGAETTNVGATVSLLDNAGNSIIDNVWAWRADHGNAVGWTQNTGATGVVVTGDNVTSYGLFVEHYQKYEVVWSGQGGTNVFLQNELPYDPPSQSAWMASPSQDGYPAFLVTRNVRTFQGYGMGSYVVFINTKATLFDAEAFQAPNTPGVQFHNVFALWIAGSGGDNSVINGVGGPATSTNPGTQAPQDVVSYP